MAFDADAIAAAVLQCSSVTELSAGRGVTVATYLPGRRVEGIREVDDTIEVHVVAGWGVPIPSLAREVRAAVGGVAAEQPVAIFVDDIADPESIERAGDR